MSESDSSQEKTHEATPKRLEKAKEDGQVPRSKEMTTTAVLMVGTLGIFWFGGYVAQSLIGIYRLNFSLSREDIFDTHALIDHLAASIYQAFLSLMPIFFMLLLAALLAPIALGGWLCSSKSLMPKMSRMNPLEGLKRMFSSKALIELGKALAKVVFIILLAILLLQSLQQDLLGLAYEDLLPSIVHAMELAIYAAMALSAVTIFIAIIDVPVQLHENAKKLKMTLQEVKDEMKDSDGKPEVKSRIRQLQQEVAQRKMMAAVPDADVIITNPTHYSVAVRYHLDTMATPIVVAKGVDKAAFTIRDIAGEHNIECVESAVLARAIYYTTKVDEEIPEGLYIAVAKVLAYVFQMQSFKKGLAKRPAFPYSVPIPDDLYFDA